jgi:hypothetical protein
MRRLILCALLTACVPETTRDPGCAHGARRCSVTALALRCAGGDWYPDHTANALRCER